MSFKRGNANLCARPDRQNIEHADARDVVTTQDIDEQTNELRSVDDYRSPTPPR
jgi:hypothetical protein